MPWHPTSTVIDVATGVQQDQGPSGARRVYITRSVIERPGPTEGCPACDGEGTVHLPRCRARMERLIQENAAAAVPVPEDAAGAPS